VTGEIAAVVGEEAFDFLDAPVARLGAPNVPVPYGTALEHLVVPSEEQVMQKILELFGAGRPSAGEEV
jgi:pyruvate dehydrogenase E1 component beta subunit